MGKYISWEYCQNKSDLILNSGLFLLKQVEERPFNEISVKNYGNYIITDKTGKWNYIGEAKNLTKRIRQHFKIGTSTFYKNYLKIKDKFPELPQKLNINDFFVKAIITNIGRKELEEFGIVNLPAILNKFQIGKRNLSNDQIELNLWYSIQDYFQEILVEGENILKNSLYYNWFEAKIPSLAGLYIVKNKEIGYVYIGESSDMFERYKTHSTTTYFSALRRHIGEDILGFKLKIIKGKKRYFTEDEDLMVTNFLRSCMIKFLAISFGRYEFEEYLIRKYKPFLNRKENR